MGTTSAGPAGKRNASIECIRLVCAYLICAYHYNIVGHDVFASGFIAVDLFYAIGGYFLLSNLKPTATDQGVAAFAWQRAKRLFPLYAVGLSIGVVKELGKISFAHQDAMAPLELSSALASNLLLLPWFGSGDDLYPLNGPTWYLAFDMIAATSFYALRRRLSVSFLTVSCFIAAIVLSSQVIAAGTMNIGWSWQTATGGLARAIAFYALGGLVGRLVSERMSVATPMAFLTPLIVLIGLSGVFKGAGPLVEFVMAFVLSTATLVLARCYELPDRTAEFFRRRGSLSYAIFCVHFPMVFIFAFVAKKAGFDPAFLLPVFLLLVTSVALGAERLVKGFRGRSKSSPLFPSNAAVGGPPS